MIKQGVRQTFEHNTVIFYEGAAGDAAYIIEEGLVEISLLSNGKKHTVAVLGKGDVFGEMALIDDSFRSATATAIERTQVLVISRRYVEEKLQQTDPLLNFFLQTILERLRDLEHQIYFRRNEKMVGIHPPWERETRRLRRNEAHEFVLDRLRLHQDLLHAFENGEFQLYYQPIVSLGTEAIAGFEVLIRWNHPDKGLVSPIDFIGATEETGLIVPIGAWILDSACLALKSFQERINRLQGSAVPLYMSINFSCRQFLDAHLIGEIEDCVERHGIDPARITMEITESLLMSDPEAATSLLEGLKELGLKIAVDDFGTGYSSLSYLHRFPIDTIKIDKSFVDSMIGNHKSYGIVQILTKLARNLGMDVVAEGIEAPEQVETLQKLSCNYGQGFLFSRPLSETKALQMLGEKPGGDNFPRQGQNRK